jgi:ribosome-binding factor A
VTRKRRTQRLRRVDEVLRQVISDELIGRSDPRLDGVVVTGVESSADVAHAQVFVHLPANEHRRPKALEALERARPSLQARINAEMHLRLTPILHFVEDDTLERAMRIEQLLAEHRPLASSEDPA